MSADEYTPASEIAGQLSRVRSRIRAACERSGRREAEVSLIAVSKLKPFADIAEAGAAGVEDFGENYVQELTGKIAENAALPDPLRIRWHMIGHLQKNKVKYLIGRTALIHSVDSVPLAAQIEKEAAKQDRTERILLEVNVAGEESKWGFSPASVRQAAREVLPFPHVRVLGLMTSAPLTDDPETNRPYFRALASLARELAAEGLLAPEDSLFRVPVLSMGMTGDFEVAVEEGATMVRVGTAIFGKREPQNGGTKK
ncbi:MAG: YggS family pyridoxal phosphate-dependent enzyme [Clostridia bacterium]|nr:YggS family pyridoxal phosphate-dependent enzyme [Clostridia bacterium]